MYRASGHGTMAIRTADAVQIVLVSGLSDVLYTFFFCHIDASLSSSFLHESFHTLLICTL